MNLTLKWTWLMDRGRELGERGSGEGKKQRKEGKRDGQKEGRKDRKLLNMWYLST